MSKIKIFKESELYIYLECEDSIKMELNQHFSFRPEGYKWMPTYRSGTWDGFLRIYNLKTSKLYLGLINDVLIFAKERNYEIEIVDKLNFDVKDELDYFSDENLKKIFKFEPYDYQLNAVKEALTINKGLILSPTGSGKSGVIYLLSRFIIDRMGGNVLIIVPTVSLVSQMISDFKSYCIDFDIESICYPIYAGVSKDLSCLTGKRIVVSTYQSLYKLPDSFFRFFNSSNVYPGFGNLIIDEVHLAEGKSIQTIINKCSNFIFKVGLTGTLKNSKTHEMQLKGLIGPVIKCSTTKELMDRNVVSKLEIHNLVLNYTPEEKELIINADDYQAELKYISQHEKRNKLIASIAEKETGNVLILFTMIGHGEAILNILKDSKKKIIFLYGENTLQEREEARALAEKESGLIILASYGIFSTGVSIKNLSVGIFASPYKSKIKVLQSIGRLLRLHESKEYAKLIDITDSFCINNDINTLFVHGIERLKLYKSEKFNVKSIKIDI